jgi:UDP-glucose 4-epimerase
MEKSNDTILITGGAGYIGSHLNKYLTQAGFNTVVLDNLSNGRRDFVKWGKFIEGDIGDGFSLKMIFLTHQIKLVIHCATDAYSKDVFLKKQVDNAELLLNGMAENGVKYFVFPSSHEVFGWPLYSPIDEYHPRLPITKRGQLHLQIEELLSNYERSRGIKHAILRFQNAAGSDMDCEIGELHLSDNLIPSIVDGVINSHHKVSINNAEFNTPDGSLIEDYLHVDDLSNATYLAILKLLEGEKSEEYNLCNGNGFSALEVIEAASKVIGQKSKLNYVNCLENVVPALKVSCNKAFDLLKWTPNFKSIESIIQSAWHFQLMKGRAKYNSFV